MDFAIDTTCRTCLSEGELKSIFEKVHVERNKLFLCEMVTECTSVKIIKDDKLPNKICKKCIQQLRQAYLFMRQCQNADAILHSHSKSEGEENTTNKTDARAFDSPKEEAENSIVKEESDDEAVDFDHSDFCETYYFNGEERDETSENANKNRSETGRRNVKSERAGADSDPTESETDKAVSNGRSKAKVKLTDRVLVQKRRKKRSWDKCEKCDETFADRHSYYKHQISEHREKVNQCNKCGKCFARKDKLATHSKIHGGEKPHSCPVCNRAFLLRASLTRHLSVHSSDAPFSCEHCGKPYRTGKSLRIHVREMHFQSRHESNGTTEQKKYSYDEELNMYICKLCGRGFPSELTAHQHCVHHEKQRKCDKCEETFVKKSDLLKHKLSVHGEKYHQCGECGKCFKFLSLLQKHIKLHTGEKLFSCEKCGRKYSCLGSLNRHTKLHRGERPHMCHFCYKTFSQGSTLADHLKVHTGETPYKCQHCDKSFRTSGILRMHVKQKHSKDIGDGDKQPKPAPTTVRKLYNFLCSTCGKRFNTTQALDVHSNVHTGLKPYQCMTCGRSFSHPASLKTHGVVHTGEKRYKCELCNRAFALKGHVTYHMRTHTGEKPYACAFCGKCFALKLNLTVHLRIHTGETPYQCPVCGKGFKSSNNMKKHQRSHANKKDATHRPYEVPFQ